MTTFVEPQLAVQPGVAHTASQAAIITVAGQRVLFETGYAPAFDYLRGTPEFFDGIDYAFSGDIEPTGWTGPRLAYAHGAVFAMTFDERVNRIALVAPWARIPNSSMLRMALWLATEVERQQAGEYLVHASAVVREGRAILFSGAGESGKTTTALELCRRHGYALFSNDQTTLGLRDGTPWLLRGDPLLNFRLKSLMRYSENMAHAIFGEMEPGAHAWNVKRRLSPEEIGLASSAAPAPLTDFVFIKLDDSAEKLSLRELSGPCSGAHLDRDARLLAKIALFEELCRLIRGSGFTPFDSNLDYADLFIPSLDRPDYLARRLAFLDGLFSRARVRDMRGRLEDVIAALA